MLKDDFFRMLTIDMQVDAVKAVVELNPDHDIFMGHFPGTPVVPGVCMMQMVKEIVAMSVGKALRLAKADSMKFLSVIDPRVDRLVAIDLTYKLAGDAFDINASLSVAERMCFKFKGRFVVFF